MRDGARVDITKCGNAHARWLLVECAQHYASATQSEQGTEPTPARSIGFSPGHQLARAEPVASSLHAFAGAATPAQQSDGGYRAGAMRFHLGTVAHPTLLSGTESPPV